MPGERSLESQDQPRTESLPSEAVDWGKQFVKHLELEYADLASRLPEEQVGADLRLAMMLSVVRVLAESGADSDSIAFLLEEAGKTVKSPDVARVLSHPGDQYPNAFSSEDAWKSVLNESSSITAREAALCLCVERDEERTAAFLVDELARNDIATEWQDALVLCAETIQFHEDAVRQRLWSRLLEIALRRRREPDDTVSKPVVFSAIRCLTSMIPVEELSQLLPFLEPPAPLETRLVTLQCVTNVFEAGPPTAPDQLVQLRDRIHELAIKFLDRDWLIAGERAAIALNAIQALACLGDDRLTSCVSQVLAMQMDWFARQVSRKLQEVADGWEGIEDCQPLHVMREQLVLLRESASTS